LQVESHRRLDFVWRHALASFQAVEYAPVGQNNLVTLPPRDRYAVSVESLNDNPLFGPGAG
jgi:hypothetical protein